MAFKFTLDVDGHRQVSRAFNRVKDHIEDLRPIWDHVQRDFNSIEESQFKSEGAKGGTGKWKELSRPYAKSKAKKYPGAKILHRTGRMEAALTGQTTDSLVVKEKQEFGIGTSLFYPIFHQRGTGNMPKRPPVDLSNSQKRDMQKGIQRGLLEIIKRDPLAASHLNFD